MTREQIEKKAEEMANKYTEVGYNSKYHREIYAAAMEMAEWLLFSQWVRVEDDLPKEKQDVFIKLADGRSTSGWYSHTIEEWFISVGEIGGDDCLSERVTHWMPIPLPLAEEGGEDEHVGQSEDLYDYLHGRDSEIDIEEQRRQEEAYYQEMYNRHEQEMQQMFDALAEEGGEK